MYRYGSRNTENRFYKDIKESQQISTGVKFAYNHSSTENVDTAKEINTFIRYLGSQSCFFPLNMKYCRNAKPSKENTNKVITILVNALVLKKIVSVGLSTLY